jgi:CheY-like chemotaxis protein
LKDNLINQSLLKKQLIGSGYRVSVANHGQEAIDKVLASQNSPKDRIHIVLMDVEMPVLDVCPICNLPDLRDSKRQGVFARRRRMEKYESTFLSLLYFPIVIVIPDI